MIRRFALAVAHNRFVDAPGNDRRLRQNLFDISVLADRLAEDCTVHLRWRDSAKQLKAAQATVLKLKEQVFLRAEALCRFVEALPHREQTLLLFFEGSPSTARCIVALCPEELWHAMETLDPPMRPAAYDLPPITATVVDAEEIYAAIYDLIAGEDPELFDRNAQEFLASPHILVPLFAHVLAQSSSENIDFPLVLKTTAEQLRLLLSDPKLGPTRIKRIQRDHSKLWTDVLGERIAFLDGGVARVAGIPTLEPLALRVGIYSVVPGEVDLKLREDWELSAYVLGDMICKVPGHDEAADAKRLQEAARYVLEPLTALNYLQRHTDIAFLLLHGPLVNQFAIYNEGEPNYLPLLDAEFLARYGFNEAKIRQLLHSIPRSLRGVSLWNQFMAIYGAVMKEVFSSSVPIAGVVERTVGGWLADAVLRDIVREERTTEAHAQKIRAVIRRFEISDDFLFGCILEEGEYLEPMLVYKNPERRAVHHWMEVVRQYPNPYATVLKTSATGFPFRIEMNPGALKEANKLLRLLYHTARLLPRYAFPVGLDIADRYAKVPDWLGRGVSTRIAGDVLQRALATGDARIVAQVRQLLARTPRDFFYRPHV